MKHSPTLELAGILVWTLFAYLLSVGAITGVVLGGFKLVEYLFYS